MSFNFKYEDVKDENKTYLKDLSIGDSFHFIKADDDTRDIRVRVVVSKEQYYNFSMKLLFKLSYRMDHEVVVLDIDAAVTIRED